MLAMRVSSYLLVNKPNKIKRGYVSSWVMICNRNLTANTPGRPPPAHWRLLASHRYPIASHRFYLDRFETHYS